jgi:hypothetical protein
VFNEYHRKHHSHDPVRDSDISHSRIAEDVPAWLEEYVGNGMKSIGINALFRTYE